MIFVFIDALGWADASSLRGPASDGIGEGDGTSFSKAASASFLSAMDPVRVVDDWSVCPSIPYSPLIETSIS